MGKNIVKAAGLVLAINIGVKLLGFVREMVIANGFGASSQSDAYLVAYTIPYFLQAILGYAFISAVLPLLAGYWQTTGDNEEACRIGSTLINLVTVFMAALSVLGVLIAPLLVRLTAPGLSSDTAALAVNLTRVIFPALAFMSAGMIISGILNSRYRFAAVAVAPGVTSAIIIIAVAVFAHGNIYVAAIGTLLGFIGYFAVQAIDLPHSGFRYRLVFDIHHPAVRRVLREIIPIMIGLSVTQIYTVINRIFASGLAEGSISALNYASKLMNVPLGLFVSAIITAVFPRLAELAQDADKTHLARSVSRGMSMTLLISVPSALGMMLLDTPIIRLLFERGSFTAADTLITAESLFAMSPGMIFLAISMLLLRVCYALGDVKTPLITGAFSVAVNIIVSLLLTNSLAHIGLAWANTLASAANALFIMVRLQRQLPFINSYLRRHLLLTLLGSIIMGLTVMIMTHLFPAGTSTVSLLLSVGCAVMAGVVAYGGFLMICKCPALNETLSGLRRHKNKIDK